LLFRRGIIRYPLWRPRWMFWKRAIRIWRSCWELRIRKYCNWWGSWL